MNEEEKGKRHISSFFYISVPAEFIGKTFGQLYKSFAVSRGIIPIGILRNEIAQCYKNKMPFVLSNPPWSFILKDLDYIYLIGPKASVD
jgi:hypothetical protein